MGLKTLKTPCCFFRPKVLNYNIKDQQQGTVSVILNRTSISTSIGFIFSAIIFSLTLRKKSAPQNISARPILSARGQSFKFFYSENAVWRYLSPNFIEKNVVDSTNIITSL